MPFAIELKTRQHPVRGWQCRPLLSVDGPKRLIKRVALTEARSGDTTHDESRWNLWTSVIYDDKGVARIVAHCCENALGEFKAIALTAHWESNSAWYSRSPATGGGESESRPGAAFDRFSLSYTF